DLDPVLCAKFGGQFLQAFLAVGDQREVGATAAVAAVCSASGRGATGLPGSKRWTSAGSSRTHYVKLPVDGLVRVGQRAAVGGQGSRNRRPLAGPTGTGSTCARTPS